MIAAGKLSATATTGPGSGSSGTTTKKQPQQQETKKDKPKPAKDQQPQQTQSQMLAPSPSTSPFASSSPTAARKRDRSYSASAAVHSAQVNAQQSDESLSSSVLESSSIPVAKQPAPKTQHIPTRIQFDDQKKRAKAVKKKIVRMEPAKKQLPLFSHLPQYERNNKLSAAVGFNPSISSTDVTNNSFIHSSILRLGLKVLMTNEFRFERFITYSLHFNSTPMAKFLDRMLAALLC